MSSEDQDERQRKRELEEKKAQEEYNRLRRIELMDKHGKSSYLAPDDRARRKSEEREIIEYLRAERLVIKEKRRHSLEKPPTLPQFTVRRKSNGSDNSHDDREAGPSQRVAGPSQRAPGQGVVYYPHQGIRRSIVEDMLPGGSRRATEPLKAQLLEIIDNMSQKTKFKEDRRHSAIVSHLHPKQKTGTDLEQRSRSPSDTRRQSAEPHQEIELSVANMATSPHATATTSIYSAVTTPVPPGQKATVFTKPSPYKYNVYDSADVSAVTNVEQPPESTATDTIILPSTSSAMREGRTAEFLNDGWYQNVYYNDTNDEFSSALASSARQMNARSHMQDIKNIQSIQHMAATGPIICEKCMYGNERESQHQHPCCPVLAHAMAQMQSSNQDGTRPPTATQCDDICPKRRSMLRTVISAVKNKWPMHGRQYEPAPPELYRLNISEGSDCQGLPKRVIFDLINGEMYRPPMTTVGTNTQMGIGNSPLFPQMGIVQPGASNRLLFNPPPQHKAYVEQQTTFNKGAVVINHPQGGDKQQSNTNKCSVLKQNLRRHQERIDVYYFDHGNASYYRTTDSPGTIYTELIAERTEHHTAQYWAELFGTIHIAFALFTAFFLQLYRFVLQSTFRPIVVGFVQLTSDYMIKPVLALIFNAIIQPLLIYLYNIATSLRDLCEPIADAFGFFLREIAVPIRAFRLVEVKQHTNVKPIQI